MVDDLAALPKTNPAGRYLPESSKIRKELELLLPNGIKFCVGIDFLLICTRTGSDALESRRRLDYVPVREHMR